MVIGGVAVPSFFAVFVGEEQASVLLFCGGIEVGDLTAERLGPGATVATVICDSGLRYLSTGLW